MSALDDVLIAHRTSFNRLLRVAQRHMERGDLEQAAGIASVAANFAWEHHPGLFTSPDLEDLTVSLSEAVHGRRTESRDASSRAATPVHVLHVLSRVFVAGGHTRLASSWISLDRSRKHSVVLTCEQDAIPEDLQNQVEKSGGSVIRLGSAKRRLLETAHALASLAGNFDALVLHIHPFDVVPNIALASFSERPPVLLSNHADHVFWVGTRVSDSVVCFRPSGHHLASKRRGIPDERIADIPLPIRLPRRNLATAAAKDALGISRDRTVLLTVASEYKFQSLRRPDLLDILTPVLLKFPEAILIAIGPSQTGRWEAAAAQTGNAVRALGVLPNTSLYREAADIYLDSAPFSSNTSVLESASLGTPTIAYAPGRRADAVTICDLPGLEDSLIRGSDPETYTDKLARLISDPDHRQAVGQNLKSQIAQTYDPETWCATVSGIYQLLEKTPRNPTDRLGSSKSFEQITEVDHDVVGLTLAQHGPLAIAYSLLGNDQGRAVPRWMRVFAQLLVRLDSNALSRFSLRLRRVPPRWWSVVDRILIR